MAGGPSTPALAAAVSNAGGIGFVAAGYRSVDDVARELAEVAAATRARSASTSSSRPRTTPSSGSSPRTPGAGADRGAAVRRRARRAPVERRRLGGEARARRPGTAGGRLVHVRLPLVRAGRVPPQHRRRSLVHGHVAGRGHDRVRGGADALVVQGAEAGGHNGSYRDDETEPVALLALLQLVRRVTEAPLVAAGGIATGSAVAAVLAAGAAAAQVGTALMLAPGGRESEAHRGGAAGNGRRPPSRGLSRAARPRHRQRVHARPRPSRAACVPAVHALTAPVRAGGEGCGRPRGTESLGGAGIPARSSAARPAELVARVGGGGEAIRRAP